MTDGEITAEIITQFELTTEELQRTKMNFQ